MVAMGSSHALNRDSGALEERGLWRIIPGEDEASEGCVLVGWWESE